MSYGAETYFLRMADGSMSPQLEEGDWLWVDPDEPAEPGRLVAIEDPETGERTARLMVDGRVLRAVSGDRPDIVVTRDNETLILGTVVFMGSRP